MPDNEFHVQRNCVEILSNFGYTVLPPGGPNDEMIDKVGRYMNPGKWWDEPELWKGSIDLYREQARDLIEVVIGAVGSDA